ncbi:MAG: hypothetical protein ABSE56_18625 [Bryobacteraceae bacterium]|jgi:DUF4097 and DUF4098 domain-containing protein YvlB
MFKGIRSVCWLAPVVLFAAVEEKQTIQKTFPAAKRIEVENVNGSIRVAGYDGREVQLTVHETLSGDSKEKLEQARREVKLDISTPQEGTLRLYVDGPFRSKCRDGSVNFHEDDAGYTFRHEFEIKAPRDVAVYLRNINGGAIKVENVAGDYDVKNINGGVEMIEVAGSGRAYSLNGGLKVLFRSNPRAQSYFGSLNGPVDLFFQPDLAADLRMKTFNGNIYSDFPVTPLAAHGMTAERRDGKQVYRADRFTGGRVGNGGPEIKLDGFNGDIRILKRQ